jgi:putative phosphoserine phosphatase/1-acylglycerol-3-phosphate O-acyltransferase
VTAKPPAFPLRGILTFPIVLLWALGYAGFVLGVFFLTPKRAQKNKDRYIRLWGIGILKILGVHLEIYGKENFDSGTVLYMPNHVSVLDLGLWCANWAGNTVVLYKKEFDKIPFLGRTLRRLQMIPIDRKNRERAVKSLEEAADCARKQGKSILIAPEGTRSKNGHLLPFKKGPFHLAIAAGIPIVPCIFCGITDIVPNGSWLARPGTVTVRFLSPVQTKNWTTETLDDHVAEIRKIFLGHLPDSSH